MAINGEVKFKAINSVPVFKSTANRSAANKFSTIVKNATFTATLFGTAGWYKLTKGTYKDKYVWLYDSAGNALFTSVTSGNVTESGDTYVVKSALLYAYKALAETSANRAGVLRKDSTFKATKYSGDWYKITSGSYAGFFVKLNNNNFIKQTGSNTNNTTEATTTTTDTGTTTPTDGTGGSPAETDYSYLFPTGVDEEFEHEYTSYMDIHEYESSISNGLAINDIRSVLGIPHQFLPNTDMRINGTHELTSLGRVYTDKILRYMPLLLITPGIPSFMAGFSDDQKEHMMDGLLSTVIGEISSAASSVIGMDDYFGKYYSLKYAYVDYFKYVNAMLRSAAVFLGIHNITINEKLLGEFNWLYNVSEDNINANKFFGPYVGAVAFYADCGTTVSDSFSNSTTQSQLANAMDTLSDTGRELNFLVGNVGSLAGIQINALTGQEDLESNMETVRSAINGTLQGSNILSNILNKAQTILAGGRLVFPEIWSDSSFGRSYSCSMKLIATSGDKLSIYLNILVPIYHLLGMCLPRQSIQQSYFSPFLLRCYYKGLFNVDMGIMTGLSINKGAESEWSYDGIPTIAEVSFEIKDLYDGMFMSRAELSSSMNILSNITELDYIANSCGININDQEVTRTLMLWKVLNIDNNFNIDNIAYNLFAPIGQFFNQQFQNLFGVFN